MPDYPVPTPARVAAMRRVLRELAPVCPPSEAAIARAVQVFDVGGITDVPSVHERSDDATIELLSLGFLRFGRGGRWVALDDEVVGPFLEASK